MIEPQKLVNAQGESFTVDQAIANLRQREDPSLRYYAAWWLGRFRVTKAAAIEALQEALSDETDRSPDGGFPLRRNAARALGKLGRSESVPALIQCLNCADYYVREAATEALGALADGRAVSPLLTLMAGGVEAAVLVPGKPHLVQPYGAIIEALGQLGDRQAIATIEPFLNHSVQSIQNAATRALYQLTGEAHYGERLVHALRAGDLQQRRSALMDLGAIGYLPAADAIASATAENSLKLIALKGVLEHELGQPPHSLSADSQRVMALMDSLL
ncbi:Phycocyanobilin lyase subunit alpha [Halomicronema hongdechloris C2206]|uniref:Phycocyanobilin lyase subunit alpha n=1 Tax=Halomicronema hongdechloris C2206 TaxID=1641165 RepID=A0A1Z3HK52_9CYAN|nr:HEAT repeat domain-containing protein [Halomicronema hongdechloris]ASC70692.1 Phycocyanobilin lyase subunit alpha [Halomicronema hongdechloris C2206]